eukprot:2613600-Prymnesium_polylepis.2
MVYEGVCASGTHRLGCAVSEDGGQSWAKMEGGVNPILAPGGAGGEWTAQVVGTPFVVPLPGGGLRLYFCAKPTAERGGMCIGALDSPTGDVAADAWRPAVSEFTRPGPGRPPPLLRHVDLQCDQVLRQKAATRPSPRPVREEASCSSQIGPTSFASLDNLAPALSELSHVVAAVPFGLRSHRRGSQQVARWRPPVIARPGPAAD